MVERRPGVMPPKPGPPPRQIPPGRIMRRRVAALAAVVIVVGVVVALVKVAGHGSASSTPTTATVAAPKPFRIVFPEGFSRAEMAQRVQAVAAIAQRKRHGKKVRLERAHVPRSRRTRDASPASARRSARSRAFSFLRRTTSSRTRRRRSSCSSSSRRSRRTGARSTSSYARKKNLTPYDVLIIASLVEKEALVPDERPKIARVIYNRLHAGMNLGIDATTRYGLHVPGTKSLTRVRPPEQQPLQHAQPEHHRPAADADREPGPRLDAGRGTSRAGRLAVLRAQARPPAPLLHEQLQRLHQPREPVRLPLTVLIDRWRHAARRDHSGTRSRTRSRRGCRTRPSRRARSNWAYVALDVEPEQFEDGGARARRLRASRAPT